MTSYHYSPLIEGQNEIRLIILHSAPFNADIKIDIYHVSENPKPAYEALSYVWGNPERTDKVFVGTSTSSFARVMAGHQWKSSTKKKDPLLHLPITKNLVIALRHLRHNNHKRALWIDAICINQEDLTERSAEVLKMDEIYSGAGKVIVWLGPSNDDSDLAIGALTNIGSGAVYDRENQLIDYRSGSWIDQLHKDPLRNKAYKLTWIAIKQLLNREWFSRLWVFQEITLAQFAVVQVGLVSLEWRVFGLALQWIWTNLSLVNSSLEDLAITNFGDSSLRAFLQVTLEPFVNWPIPDLLMVTRKLNCFDDRDRLFAIRSLSLPDHREFIVPDYSKSVDETFISFTSEIIRGTNRLEILRKCSIQEIRPILNIPSWVPNFSVGNSLPYEAPRTLMASGSSESFFTFEDSKILTVQGVRIANIKFLNCPVGYSQLQILDTCRLWWSLILKSASGLDNRFLMDLFLEVLLLGNVKPTAPRAALALEECKRVFFPLHVVDTDNASLEVAEVTSEARLSITGRAFFYTEEGSFGLCPESARIGDVAVVLLGCSTPLILRPSQLGERTCYRVVGECYVPGLMCAEMLLGKLPLGWRAEVRRLKDETDYMRYVQNNRITQQHPRVNLPPNWGYRYGEFEKPEKVEPRKERKFTRQWFKNVETGEKTYLDPRLTPDQLKQRGVDIQDFTLI